MNEMIERVARALCEDAAIDPDGTEGWLIEAAPIVPDKGEPNWHAFEPLARCAIEAMREPTEAMLCRGADQLAVDWRNLFVASNAQRYWHAMIDEALKPSPPSHSPPAE